MLSFLAAGENLAFVIALAVMLLVGIVEVAGLGASMLGSDFDIDAGSAWLGWLGFGRLPLLMLIVLFLACFGVVGLIGQQIAADLLGSLLPSWAAVPGAALLALPLTGLFARGIGRIMPRDETTAILQDQLVGLHGHIVVGTASRGHPARTRVRDFHGQDHYVMAEPDMPDARFAEGDEILLVRREGQIFRAISSGAPPFSQWIER